MSRPGPIYAVSMICDLFFILSLVLVVITYNIIKTEALVFGASFRISPIIFGW